MDRRSFLTMAAAAVLAAGCTAPTPKVKIPRPNRKANPDAINAPTRYGYQLRKRAGLVPTKDQIAANNRYNNRYRSAKAHNRRGSK